MSRKPQSPGRWPTPAQLLLLRASLLDGTPAISAWKQWLTSHDIASVDRASFYVLPQLYCNLKRLGVDDPALNTLRGNYKYTWCKNQTATCSLVEVIQLLEQTGIDTIVLKGIPVLLFHYQDLGARLMNDIDLLIRYEDLPAASAALEDSAWSLTEPLPPEVLVPFCHGIHYRHPKWIELDLHWRPFTVDCPVETEQQLWQRTLKREVRGVMTNVPDPTDLLLLTCLHSRKLDAQATCRWVIDAMMLIKAADPPIDWEALLERTRQVGLTLPVRDTLSYLRQEFDAAVPEEFVRRLGSLPISSKDNARYRELITGTRMIRRSLRELIVSDWWRYSSVSRSRGHKLSAAGFARYVLSYYQWKLQVRRQWQVPFKMLMQLARRSGTT